MSGNLWISACAFSTDSNDLDGVPLMIHSLRRRVCLTNFNSFILFLLLHCKLFLFCQPVDTRWTALKAVCRRMDGWLAFSSRTQEACWKWRRERRERELFIVDEVKVMKRKGFSNWVWRRRRKKCFFQCRSLRIKRERTHYILTFIVDWLPVIDRDDGNFEEARSFRTIP